MTTQQKFKTLADVKFATRHMFASNDGLPPNAEYDDKASMKRSCDQEDQSNQATSTDTAKPSTHYETLMFAASSLEAELASSVERVAMLEKQLEQSAEKVKFYDAIANTTELYNCSVTAKTVGMGKNGFMQLMRKLKVMTSSGYNKNLPMQKYINAGFLVTGWVNILNRQTGELKPTPVPLFTGKGLIWVKKLIEKKAQFVA